MITRLFSGAVANGRAKFEAVSGSQPSAATSGSSAPSEKPLRFFSSSRSRGNSPLLPVKTPKVPTTVAASQPSTIITSSNSQLNQQQQSQNVSNGNSKDQPLAVSKKKNSLGNPVAVHSTGLPTKFNNSQQQQQTTLALSPNSNSKLFPKMKR